jgi:hypothetical protein
MWKVSLEGEARTWKRISALPLMKTVHGQLTVAVGSQEWSEEWREEMRFVPLQVPKQSATVSRLNVLVSLRLTMDQVQNTRLWAGVGKLGGHISNASLIHKFSLLREPFFCTLRSIWAGETNFVTTNSAWSAHWLLCITYFYKRHSKPSHFQTNW